MIHSDISHFITPYTALNGITEIPASRLGVARAVMMVGHACYRDAYRAGVLRLTQLLCMALGNVRSRGGRVCLDRRFHQLEKSEKDSIAYHLGMGLTKLSAEFLLDIPWLVHYRTIGTVTRPRGATPVPPKVQLYVSHKRPREPDLVGLDTNRDAHVFEAKGSGSRFKGSELQHAIGQVSQVAAVNGRAPRTRVACFFECSTAGIDARIVDPDGDDPPVSIVFDEEEFFREYYRMFLGDPSWAEADIVETAGRAYRVQRMGAPDLFFGIREDYYEALQSGKAASALPLLARDDEGDRVRAVDLQDELISVSRDGTVLINFGAV
jgi:hypothetical protein